MPDFVLSPTHTFWAKVVVTAPDPLRQQAGRSTQDAFSVQFRVGSPVLTNNPSMGAVSWADIFSLLDWTYAFRSAGEIGGPEGKGRVKEAHSEVLTTAMVSEPILKMIFMERLQRAALAAVVDWDGVVDARHLPVEFSRKALEELAANPFAAAAITKAYDKTVMSIR